MNGTVYKALPSTSETACAAACTADGPHCAAFAMPLGPAAKLCHLLKTPLIEWFDGATGHPCRCAVKLPVGVHWEGPGENDLVQLQDGSLLTVFRVNSCAPCASPVQLAIESHIAIHLSIYLFMCDLCASVLLSARSLLPFSLFASRCPPAVSLLAASITPGRAGLVQSTGGLVSYDH